jgi:glycosyltransferase involved in cell wall biosynthesis
VPYSTFLEAIQISSAHIYFTYPFVLSWSALEAMSAGCVIIGSDTPPVREVIKSGETGLLVPFFDHEQLSERVVEVLQSPREFQPLRRAARRHIVENFDAKRICIPQLKEIVEKVAAEQNIASARSPSPRTRVAAAVKSRSALRKKAT